MKTKWLKKESNKKLTLFFAGWGMDETPVSHLKIDNDFLIAYDYTNLDFNEDLNNYESITLIAWSFGVFVASHIAKKIPHITKSIAINGTSIPIDINFGINPKVFKLTLKTLSPKSLMKFTENMFDKKEDYLKFKRPNRTFESQKEELKKIAEHYEHLEESTFNYDYAIISNNDKIIPTKNQKAYWQNLANKVKVVELDCGHYPFFEHSSWDEIIGITK